MKKGSIICLLLIVLIAITSCKSKVYKMNAATGLELTANGFMLDEVNLEVDDVVINDNKIPLGKSVSVVVSGVNGFKEKDGHISPGCTMVVTDKSGKEILNIPDLFNGQKEALTSESTNRLYATFTTGDPMKADEQYFLKVRFYDDYDATSEIITTINLLITK